MSGSEKPPNIKFFDFSTREASRIAQFGKEPAGRASEVTVSPDGQWLLYAQQENLTENIMLVEKFH